MNRILALVLALIMTLLQIPAAASAEAPAKGGFVEREIPIPQGYLSTTPPTNLTGGGIAVAAMAEDGAWWLLSWASLDAEPTATKLEVQLGDELRSLRAAPDGSLLAELDPFSGSAASSDTSVQDEPDEDAEQQAPIFLSRSIKTPLVWFDVSGSELARFEVDSMPLGMCALSGRRTAVADYSSGITIYDERGAQSANIPCGSIYSMTACGDNLLLQVPEQLQELDVSGKLLRAVPISLDYNAALCAAPDGTAYVLTSRGIDRLDPGATEFVHMSGAAGFSIGDPSAYISGACALDGQAIVTLLNGGGVSVMVSSGGTSIGRGTSASGSKSLTAYIYDSELDLGNRAPFRVTALYDSGMLRKAVSDFQRIHPELNVQLQASLEAGDTTTPAEDHIRTINTDLLAGNGGDVLVLDGLPWQKYAQKGVLDDLTEIAEGLGLMPGIHQGSRSSDGKLYAIPAQFLVTALWGRKQAIDGLTDLQSIQNAATESGQTPMYGRSPEAWLRLFYPASESAFRDEAGKLNLDTPEFAAFLEALYQLYSNQAEQPEAGARAMQRLDGQALAGMFNGANALMSGVVASTMDTSVYYTAAGNADGAAAMVPSVNGAGSAYEPKLLAGICAQTTNRALSEEFIRLLFSKEIQALNLGEGLPTVAAALDEMIASAKEMATNDNIRMALMTEEGGAPMNISFMDAEAWDALRAEIDTLNYAALVDETLMGFIVEETASFFKGSLAAEDAARAVMQRASAYLNE